MYCRSISFFICMFMAVSLATLHKDNDSTKDWSTKSLGRSQPADGPGRAGPGAAPPAGLPPPRFDLPAYPRDYALEDHPKEAAQVSHLLYKRLAGIGWRKSDDNDVLRYRWSGPATMEGQSTTTEQAETTVTTQPLTEPSTTSATAAPALASCPTSPLDEDAVSRLRNLSKEERDRRLMQAAKQGAVGALRELLAAGADVGAREAYNETALHFAALKGRVEAASCLLAAGADVEAKDGWWWTPLHKAAFGDQAAMVRLLVAASADPNARDYLFEYTPLHVAAWSGKPEAAVALLEVGADRDAWSFDGSTPLEEAYAKGQQQLIEILTRYGATRCY